MPRVRRRSKRRSAEYDPHHVRHLLNGMYLHPGCGFTTTYRNYAGDFTDSDAMRPIAFGCCEKTVTETSGQAFRAGGRRGSRRHLFCTLFVVSGLILNEEHRLCVL